MNIEIRKLTPDLAEEYVRFFDVTPHDDNVEEHRCYCVCWCSDDHETMDLSTPEKRRAYAVHCIQNDILQGYLAYCDNRVVGWCNANTKADCLKCYSWRRFMGAIPTEEVSPDIRVKSIFCFVIAPEMKRKGIATRLVKRICRDAALDGFNFVESYPNKEPVEGASEFGGPLQMYKRSGFTVYHEAEQELVMRKALK